MIIKIIKINESVFHSINIAPYCLKQHMTIYVDEVLPRSRRGGLTDSRLQLPHR